MGGIPEEGTQAGGSKAGAGVSVEDKQPVSPFLASRRKRGRPIGRGLNSGPAWQLCAAGGGAGPCQRGLHDDPGHWSGPPLPRRWPEGLGAPLLVPGPLSQGRGAPALLWNRKVKTFASDVTKGSCSQAGGRRLRSLPWMECVNRNVRERPRAHRPPSPRPPGSLSSWTLWQTTCGRMDPRTVFPRPACKAPVHLLQGRARLRAAEGDPRLLERRVLSAALCLPRTHRVLGRLWPEDTWMVGPWQVSLGSGPSPPQTM